MYIYICIVLIDLTGESSALRGLSGRLLVGPTLLLLQPVRLVRTSRTVHWTGMLYILRL